MVDPSFVAVGDVMVDITASGSGHEATIALAAGGSAVNAVFWAAAGGADTTIVGRVGDDLAGRALRAALEERGVRAKLSVDTDAPTGMFLVVDGEIRADRGANARFEPEARRLTGADAEEAARLLGGEFRLACVTRAAAGAVAILDGRLETVTPEPVDGVSAVGAGDAFAARFLVGLARGEDLRAALETACLAGGSVAAGVAQ